MRGSHLLLLFAAAVLAASPVLVLECGDLTAMREVTCRVVVTADGEVAIRSIDENWRLLSVVTGDRTAVLRLVLHREPHLTASNRSVAVPLSIEAVVGHAVGTASTRVTVALAVVPTPWLRYACSALGVCVLCSLLWSRAEQRVLSLGARLALQDAQGERAPAQRVDEQGVAIFSANSGTMKRVVGVPRNQRTPK